MDLPESVGSRKECSRGKIPNNPFSTTLPTNLPYLTDPSIEPGTVHTVLYLTHHQQPIACSLLGQIG